MIRSTSRFLRSFRDNIELGTLLAFVAGNVNTVAFLHFGTFVSHISGHATRSAVEYTEGNTLEALMFFLEIMAFIFGAFVTAFLLKGHTAAYSRIKYTMPIVLEVICIMGFQLIVATHGAIWFRIGSLGLSTLLLAFSMGLQNAMLRHASGTIIRTTHMTGVATDIGAELGGACSAAWQKILHDRKLGLLSWAQIRHEFLSKLRITRFGFHCLLFGFFFMGSITGTLGYIYFMTHIMYLPLAILIGLAIREYLRPQPMIPGE